MTMNSVGLQDAIFDPFAPETDSIEFLKFESTYMYPLDVPYIRVEFKINEEVNKVTRIRYGFW